MAPATLTVQQLGFLTTVSRGPAPVDRQLYTDECILGRLRRADAEVNFGRPALRGGDGPGLARWLMTCRGGHRVQERQTAAHLLVRGRCGWWIDQLADAEPEPSAEIRAAA